MSEFNLYKTNRVNEIKTKYTNIVRTLINTYNRQIAIAINTMNFRNRSARISSLKKSYEIEYANIVRQMNAEIATIILPSEINVSSGTKKALLIGINYIGTSYELSGCINDIENVSNILVGFQTIDMMTDLTALRPTKANIINQLTKLLQDAVSGDLLVFSFSGHGTQISDRNGDETDGKDEGFLTIDNLLIVDDELNAIVRQYMKSGVTLFMLFDCCHSGTICDLKYNYMGYSENTRSADTNGNVILISGCRDEQSSAEAFANGKIQGAMTCVFLSNLQPGVTWRQLITKMCAALAVPGYNQVPKLSSGRFINLDMKCLFA